MEPVGSTTSLFYFPSQGRDILECRVIPLLSYLFCASHTVRLTLSVPVRPFPVHGTRSPSSLVPLKPFEDRKQPRPYTPSPVTPDNPHSDASHPWVVVPTE